MSSNAIKWGTIILVVVFIFLWISVYIEKPVEAPVITTPVVTTPAVVANPTYTDPSGYSVSYPADYTIVVSSDNELFAKGISFVIPRSLTEGTNLSTDTRIYIEAKQGTSTCQAASYTEAGVGNFYETNVYVKDGVETCYEITHFIHSTNIANYDLGTVVPFDRAKLDNDLKIVLESFKLE